jgi:CubicO group peptidase (beta-lactamase class C family)
LQQVRTCHLLLWLAAAGFVATAHAQLRDLPRPEPESAGMSALTATPAVPAGPSYGFGLGFVVLRTSGQAAHPAEAGSYFWVDPKAELFAVLRLESPKERVHCRTLMHDRVYAAVMK